MRIIGLIVAGLIVGALGRLFHPGAEAMSLLVTVVIGIAATLVAGLLIGDFLGFLLAVLIAVGLVALVSRTQARRT